MEREVIKRIGLGSGIWVEKCLRILDEKHEKYCNGDRIRSVLMEN